MNGSQQGWGKQRKYLPYVTTKRRVKSIHSFTAVRLAPTPTQTNNKATRDPMSQFKISLLQNGPLLFWRHHAVAFTLTICFFFFTLRQKCMNTVLGRYMENSLLLVSSIYSSGALEGIVLEERPERRPFLESAIWFGNRILWLFYPLRVTHFANLQLCRTDEAYARERKHISIWRSLHLKRQQPAQREKKGGFRPEKETDNEVQRHHSMKADVHRVFKSCEKQQWNIDASCILVEVGNVH